MSRGVQPASASSACSAGARSRACRRDSSRRRTLGSGSLSACARWPDLPDEVSISSERETVVPDSAQGAATPVRWLFQLDVNLVLAALDRVGQTRRERRVVFLGDREPTLNLR